MSIKIQFLSVCNKNRIEYCWLNLYKTQGTSNFNNKILVLSIQISQSRYPRIVVMPPAEFWCGKLNFCSLISQPQAQEMRRRLPGLKHQCKGSIFTVQQTCILHNWMTTNHPPSRPTQSKLIHWSKSETCCPAFSIYWSKSAIPQFWLSSVTSRKQMMRNVATAGWWLPWWLIACCCYCLHYWL